MTQSLHSPFLPEKSSSHLILWSSTHKSTEGLGTPGGKLCRCQEGQVQLESVTAANAERPEWLAGRGLDGISGTH